MKIKISSIKAAFHYFLIYMMLTVNQSVLYAITLKNQVYILIAVAIVLCFLFRNSSNRRELQYFVVLALVLLASVFCVRIMTNGIGLIAWARWMVGPFYLLAAYMYEKDRFVERFIKTVEALALVSIVCWGIQMVNPDILKAFLRPHDSHWTYNIWSSATEYKTYSYTSYGTLFYSFTDSPTSTGRNTSIFTEPGVYQMVLNSALCCLLFFGEHVNFSRKEYGRCIVILLLAIASCQSTTGYLGLMVILLVFFMEKQNDIGIIRTTIVRLALFAIVCLSCDFAIRGEQSLLQTVLIDKLFTDTGAFSVNAGTGSYRMAMIGLCLASMISHPFGIGSAAVEAMVNASGTSAVAAAILVLGASVGIIPFLFYLGWLFAPVFKNNRALIIKFLFVFLYFNTTLGQSSAFYPVLIIPTLLCFGFKACSEDA